MGLEPMRAVRKKKKNKEINKINYFRIFAGFFVSFCYSCFLFVLGVFKKKKFLGSDVFPQMTKESQSRGKVVKKNVKFT